jgi:hypothetical protein
MGQRLDRHRLRLVDGMNAEELRKAMMNATPQPSPEKRLDWLEADSAAQRTAILKLEREVKRLINGGTILAGLVGLLLGRVFL